MSLIIITHPYLADNVAYSFSIEGETKSLVN